MNSEWTPTARRHAFGNGFRSYSAINIKFRNLPLTKEQLDLAHEIYSSERHYWLIGHVIGDMKDFWEEEHPECKMWQGGRSGGWVYIDRNDPPDDLVQQFQEHVAWYVLDWRDRLQAMLDGENCIYGYETGVGGVDFLAYPHRIDLCISGHGVVHKKKVDDMVPDITGSVATKIAWEAAVNLIGKDGKMEIEITPHGDWGVYVKMWYGSEFENRYAGRLADDVLDIPGRIYEMCLLGIKSELDRRKELEDD